MPKVNCEFHRLSRDETGITLVELLAAIAISSLVVLLASRLFLTGQHAFLDRFVETDRLSTLVVLKGSLHKMLSTEISRCEKGDLFLAGESDDMDLQAWMKKRFPEIESSDFHCFEVDEGSLSEWINRYQPQLIEYYINMKNGDSLYKWSGSVLR